LRQRVWSIGERVEAALATQPITPKITRRIGGDNRR
jgi:hypothetical protein